MPEGNLHTPKGTEQEFKGKGEQQSLPAHRAVTGWVKMMALGALGVASVAALEGCATTTPTPTPQSPEARALGILSANPDPQSLAHRRLRYDSDHEQWAARGRPLDAEVRRFHREMNDANQALRNFRNAAGYVPGTPAEERLYTEARRAEQLWNQSRVSLNEHNLNEPLPPFEARLSNNTPLRTLRTQRGTLPAGTVLGTLEELVPLRHWEYEINPRSVHPSSASGSIAIVGSQMVVAPGRDLPVGTYTFDLQRVYNRGGPMQRREVSPVTIEVMRDTEPGVVEFKGGVRGTFTYYTNGSEVIAGSDDLVLAELEPQPNMRIGIASVSSSLPTGVGYNASRGAFILQRGHRLPTNTRIAVRMNVHEIDGTSRDRTTDLVIQISTPHTPRAPEFSGTSSPTHASAGFPTRGRVNDTPVAALNIENGVTYRVTGVTSLAGTAPVDSGSFAVLDGRLIIPKDKTLDAGHYIVTIEASHVGNPTLQSRSFLQVSVRPPAVPVGPIRLLSGESRTYTRAPEGTELAQITPQDPAIVISADITLDGGPTRNDLVRVVGGSIVVAPGVTLPPGHHDLTIRETNSARDSAVQVVRIHVRR